MLATVSFIRENFFTLDFYAIRSRERARQSNSLVDKDVDFGILATARRTDCLVFVAGTGVLIHLTKSGIHLKQGSVLCVGIDEV